MTVQEHVRADIVSAMKAKDELRLSVLRSLLTMFMQELTATKRTPQDTLSDDEARAVIRRAKKQREDAAQQFRAGGRPELADTEEREASILASYLPAQLTREEIEEIVGAVRARTGIHERAKMGMLIGAVMAEVGGRADGRVVKEVIEAAYEPAHAPTP